MSYSCFTDKKHPPAEPEIEIALGPLLPTYKEFIQFVLATYHPQEDGWRYLYGKQYGWAQRFMIKKKLLVNVYPNDGFFNAQINLPETAVQEALTWNLSPSTRQVMENAPLFSEGRWLWFPVRGQAELEDVKALLALRVRTRW
jgi:hypothetical protein